MPVRRRPGAERRSPAHPTLMHTHAHTLTRTPHSPRAPGEIADTGEGQGACGKGAEGGGLAAPQRRRAGRAAGGGRGEGPGAGRCEPGAGGRGQEVASTRARAGLPGRASPLQSKSRGSAQQRQAAAAARAPAVRSPRPGGLAVPHSISCHCNANPVTRHRLAAPSGERRQRRRRKRSGPGDGGGERQGRREGGAEDRQGAECASAAPGLQPPPPPFSKGASARCQSEGPGRRGDPGAAAEASSAACQTGSRPGRAGVRTRPRAPRTARVLRLRAAPARWRVGALGRRGFGGGRRRRASPPGRTWRRPPEANAGAAAARAPVGSGREARRRPGCGACAGGAGSAAAARSRSRSRRRRAQPAAAAGGPEEGWAVTLCATCRERERLPQPATSKPPAAAPPPRRPGPAARPAPRVTARRAPRGRGSGLSPGAPRRPPQRFCGRWQRVPAGGPAPPPTRVITEHAVPSPPPKVSRIRSA